MLEEYRGLIALLCAIILPVVGFWAWVIIDLQLNPTRANNNEDETP